MNDDIIRMAREAGFTHDTETNHIVIGGVYTDLVVTPGLERFAALVAATEREACAILLENYAVQYDAPVWAFKISEAIRARGDK